MPNTLCESKKEPGQMWMNRASKMLIGKEIEKTDGEVNDTVDTFCFLEKLV